MANVKHNKLTHGVYSVRISPFINPFFYTNPGFFKPFLSIIVNLGHPMGIVLASRIPSAGLRRRVISRKVIFVINEKKQKPIEAKGALLYANLAIGKKSS